jgi:hypothetical protein
MAALFAIMAALFAIPPAHFASAILRPVVIPSQWCRNIAWTPIARAQTRDNSIDEFLQRFERITFKWIERILRLCATSEMLTPNPRSARAYGDFAISVR